MKIKCVSDGGQYKVSLKVGKVYDAEAIGNGEFYGLIDETGEEYGFPAQLFEVIMDH